MRYFYYFCRVLVLAFLCVIGIGSAVTPAFAQSSFEGSLPEDVLDSNKAGVKDGVEYGGVVTRAVISSLGELFYRRFSESWSTQKDTSNYVLTVRESRNPKTGTEVQVIYTDSVLFRALLPRTQQAVIGLSESAAEAVYQKIVDISLNELLNDDPDMARAAF